MTRIEKVETFEAFEALQDGWNRLARRDGPPLPYTRHEWLAAWWLGFGRDAALSVFVAREGAELVAAAPLMRTRRTLAGFPVRAIHGLGLNVGFVDFLWDPSRPKALGALLDIAFRDTRDDILLVRGTEAHGSKNAFLRTWLLRAGLRFETTPCWEVYFDTREGVAGYRARRPPLLLRKAEKRARELGRLGHVAFERVRGEGPWEEPLEDAFQVTLRSWKEASGTAIGRRADFRRFLRELALRFGPTGEAELCLLRVDGAAIAFRFGVSDRGVFVDHEIAFDEAWRRYSPGNLVALHSDEALILEGVTEINLGADSAWKMKWNPARRERTEWTVYRRGNPYASFVRIARAVRARIRPRGGDR